MKRLLIGLFALPFIFGCGNDTTAPNGSVTGTYDLRTVNGTQLPYMVSSGSTTSSIDTSVLTLSPDGTYNEITSISTDNGYGTTTNQTTETGTWTATNGYITFYDQTDGGLQYTGSVSGNTLTETYTDAYNNNYISVYSRR